MNEYRQSVIDSICFFRSLNPPWGYRVKSTLSLLIMQSVSRNTFILSFLIFFPLKGLYHESLSVTKNITLQISFKTTQSLSNHIIKFHLPPFYAKIIIFSQHLKLKHKSVFSLINTYVYECRICVFERLRLIAFPTRFERALTGSQPVGLSFSLREHSRGIRI